MISTKTDSELGSELMTLRGMQWIYGIKDDPYALLLRAESDDPHELGRRAREHGPMMWSTAESWVTARYDTAAALLDDARFGVRYPKPQAPDGEEASFAWQVPALHDVLPLDDVFLALDREAYRRLRGVTEAAVGTDPGFSARVSERAASLLDRLGDSFDLMTDFAQPLAARTLAGMLGTQVDPGRLAALCARAAPALDATLCPPRMPTARELITAATEIRDLVAAVTPGGPADDLFASRTLLAVAGVQLAADLTARTVSALLDSPDAAAAVREDPELVAAGIRETVRHAPPVRLQKLFAYEDVEVAGVPLTAGAEVTVLVEAAQRDPEAFAAPDRFDPGRKSGPGTLAFTDGLPTGVLEPFAVPLATAAVAALAGRLGTLRRAEPELRRLRAPVTGGVLRLPVTTTAG
ncbi:P450-derived glycosyltransferase activator [Streptomyces sp. NPDC093249]|uniref:cytochrome P450 family protein n=1 Tax=unclassified Streptomyces TaxID=2593676 RepID=UPI003819A7E7